jgi:hypothetical protein
LGTLFTLIIGFLGGVIGAVATDFVRTPFRQFFTLRTEIRHEMLRLANIAAPDPKWSAPTYSKETLDRLWTPIREAQAKLRDLGTRMIAFDETGWIAAKAVHYLGYEPSKAGHGLIGLSNSLTEYGADRSAHRASINKALKLPD